MVYKFKTGNTYRGLSAQIVGDELSRIRLKNDGKLRTEDVIKDASRKTSPIHKAFTWDDAVAGHQFRLHEARQLVRVVVVARDEESDQVPHHAFWNVRVVRPEAEGEDDGYEQYYQAADVLITNEDEYKSAVEGMKSELASAEQGLLELLSIAPRGQKTRVKRAAGHVAQAGQVLSA
jgi:hypothetical protein